MQTEIQLQQNPRVKWSGIAILLGGGVLMLASWYLKWMPGFIISDVILLSGICVRSLGIDTQISQEGINFGFTKISWDEIESVHQLSEKRIGVVTLRRRCYTFKKWHYLRSDWEIFKNTIASRMGC